MKYLSLALLMVLSACGSLPGGPANTPETMESGSLESQAVKNPGGTSNPPPAGILPGPMDSVVIFKGPVGDNIPLDGRTNVSIWTSLVMNFRYAQSQALIRATLTPAPRFGLSCSWSTDSRIYTCTSNMMALSPGTAYTLKVFNTTYRVPSATANFTTGYPVLAP